MGIPRYIFLSRYSTRNSVLVAGVAGQVPITCRETGQALTPQRIHPEAMDAHHHHIDFRRAVDMARLPTARGDGAATPERGCRTCAGRHLPRVGYRHPVQLANGKAAIVIL